MSVFRFFIERPVFSTLFGTTIVLAGLVSFVLLPVSPLPQVEFGAIQVSASLPGASAETMAATVASPLERTLGRIAGVNEMTSSNTLGNTRITLQFDLARDIDGAARDVQAAINAARTELPPLPHNPIYSKFNPADAPVLILVLTSTQMSVGELYDVASTRLAKRLLQLPGVGDVQVGGSDLPAIRISLDPVYLAKQGLALEDIREAVATHAAKRPLGAIETEGKHLQLELVDHAGSVEDYGQIIVRQTDYAVTHISDVGKVAWSVQNERNEGWFNGKPAVLLVVQRQPGANVLDTVKRIKATLPELRAQLSSDMELVVSMDASPSVRASVSRIEHTLLLSIVLVVLVVFFFLRSARATLIPAVAVPISLIGTFVFMYLNGYSLNNLSMMALVVAVGFVVDDAIVVVESIARHVEQGMPPLDAALQGTSEVGLTVLSMSACLIAVFIPVLLMGGLPGRVAQEFSSSLAVAIAISLVVSLSITPMMSAYLLRPGISESCGGFQARLHQWSGDRIANLTAAYARSLDWTLHHPRIMQLVLFAMIALNFTFYAAIPKGFFPQQDTGRLYGTLQSDQSISFQAMRTKLADFVDLIQQDPAVDNVSAFAGRGRINTATLYVNLKPRSDRDISADDVIERLSEKFASWPGATLSLQSAQDLQVGGGSRSGGTGARYQFALRADDAAVLREWEPKVRQALGNVPQVKDVGTDTQDKGVEVYLFVDRDAAARLGISMRSIDATLNDAFGQRQIAVLYQPLNQYRVVMGVEPVFREGPQALDHLFFAGPSGTQIPFSAFARYEQRPAALAVNKNAGFISSTISFNLPRDVSLSQARRSIQDTLLRIGAPTELQATFQGSAQVFDIVFQRMPWLILAAILTLYIVLGILYESFRHPLSILSTLPSAGLGALGALLIFGKQFDIVAFVGVLLLIGVVMKNGIMMVDFALAAQRSENLTAREAIRQGCLARFRPIVMTGLAAMMGAFPLALGTGEGSELGHPLGIAVIGGLMVSQVLTLYTTPVIYILLANWQYPRFEWLRKHVRKMLQKI